MPLPTLDKVTPIFDITIPSSEQVAKFRPFLVKEEKLLLIALEANEEQAMLDAIGQVITQCAVSPIKIPDLSIFDIEYIFMKLRAKSVDTMVDLAYRCHNPVPKYRLDEQKRPTQEPLTNPDGTPVLGSCDTLVPLKINLEDVQIQRNPEHNKTVLLTPDVGLHMRYPNLDLAKRTAKVKNKESVVQIMEGMAYCVESVFDSESVFSNFQLKEMVEWLEHLTQPQFQKIQQFLDTMPKLAHDVDFACPRCGHTEVIHLEGLQDFFI